MLDPRTIERMGDGAVLVALSGGGDSVALLHMLAERLGAARLHAAIVDHRLREGSHADAARAGEIAASLGIQARILELSWAPGANRAQEAARRARYAALCEAARSIGARTIAAGHTRDDQAETVFLRAARGSGLRGLGGMRAFAPAPVWPEGRGLFIARPLLGARRSELRDMLVSRRVAWIEDPANENEIHARVRARRALAALEREGLDPMRLAALAERIGPHVHSIDREALALIEAAARFEDEEIMLDCGHWRGEATVMRRALDALLTAASGEERSPGASQLDTLAAALCSKDFAGGTLGGAWLRRRGERIFIRRDPGALAGRAGGAVPRAPMALAPNQETVWDGRVALTVAEPGWSVFFDGRKAQLQRGAERRPLAAAAPHWLIKDRVQHVLGTD